MPWLSQIQLQFLRVKHWVGSRSWFPQAPLALASAQIGLMYLAPLMKDILGWEFASILFAGDLWDIVDMTGWKHSISSTFLKVQARL